MGTKPHVGENWKWGTAGSAGWRMSGGTKKAHRSHGSCAGVLPGAVTAEMNTTQHSHPRLAHIW